MTSQSDRTMQESRVRRARGRLRVLGLGLSKSRRYEDSFLVFDLDSNTVVAGGEVVGLTLADVENLIGETQAEKLPDS